MLPCMTVRFTLHMNFGGMLTASLGVGAITANSCNGNAIFTGNYTVEGCPPQNHYSIAQIGGTIVPGTTDTGNHADDTVTTVTLPFSYGLYDQSFTSIGVDSNGKAHFPTGASVFSNTCLPLAGATYTVFPYWDDQRTDTGAGCASFPGGACGIFTSVTGTAPNRIFNIEWRTVYFATPANSANYELRLYEGQSRFDVIYGTVAGSNTSATAGVQKNNTDFDQYFCNGSGGAATGGQSYTIQSCGTPTPTFTGTPSPTPTSTSTSTATPTSTATATPTGSPSCTPTYTYTVSTGTIVPGTTDTGNHADDGSTVISVPFSYTVYDQTFTSVAVGSNGHLTFGTVNNAFNPSCIPIATATYALFPYQTDQCTGPCTGVTGTNYGIFTSISGSAPNRIFNVEYRTAY